jgi:hypothetical protein
MAKNKKKELKEFTVEVREIHRVVYSIQATDEDDARERYQNDGTVEPCMTEYVDTDSIVSVKESA